MKKLIVLAALLLNTVYMFAVSGVSCQDPIEVDTAYSGSFTAGEYWFTATTASLPLTFYFYPDDTVAPAPDVYLDLTCTPGVYDDTIISGMIASAGDYNLSFPMHETPKKEYDGDKIRYRITYDRNYRDMLYNYGVTYPVAAYVQLLTYTSGNVYIVSESINTRCRDYVNTFGMDISLLIAPDDSVNVYMWPIGNWINKSYTITWESEGRLDFYDGTDCVLSRTQRVRDQFIMPHDSIRMDKRRASAWINDIYQTELYVRLYAEKEGLLHIRSFEEKTELLEFVVAGVKAVIDNENMKIYAVLPKGTNRNNAIRAAKTEGTIKYRAYNGEVPVFDYQCTKMTLGTLVYSLGNITVAKSEGSTDATLSAVLIDGDTLQGFASNTADYSDVEVGTEQPQLSVVTSDTAATVTIKQATSVPGTATVTVTAEQGNKQTYTFRFIKRRSRNTSLSAVFIDGVPLEGFSAETHHYRMYVQNLPEVTAVAADSLTAVVIDQAKNVPGFAQIFLTAEAGNTDSYTINFSIDPRIQQCAESAELMQWNKPVSVDEDDVLRVPIGRPSLDNDTANWAGRRIAFAWSGSSNLHVYVGTTCLFDPQSPDKTLIDSFDVVLQKGENRRVAYLTAEQTKALGRHSIDGTLYLRFVSATEGQLTAEDWTPDCMNTSTLIDVNSDTYFPPRHNSENVYKLYLPDWKDKQVTFYWEGTENVKLFLSYSNTCKFKLQVNTWYPVVEEMTVNANDSVVWTVAKVKKVINDCYMGDFLYIRFWTENKEGTLHVRQTGGKVPEYVITWLTDEGVKIDTTHVLQGQIPVHKDMTKSNTAEYTYTFAGWMPAPVPATENATYKAVFTAIKNKYVIQFKNDDGTVLQTDTLEYGTMPEYRGDSLLKQSTAQYHYAFAGWQPAVDTVRANTEYIAVFSAAVNRYEVRFVDEDGTLLQTDSVEYGMLPEYRGAEPHKESTAQYYYTFAGWGTDLSAVTQNITYTATYTASLRSYTITFLNEDSTVIKTDTCLYGTMPQLPQEPEKETTAQYTYFFVGWQPAVDTVRNNAVYVATFSKAVNSYTVVFMDEGVELQRDTLEYGSMPVYRNSDPQKEPNYAVTYRFLGWSPELAMVIGEQTYNAVYDEDSVLYEITILVNDTALGYIEGAVSGSYTYGTILTFVAIAGSGAEFRMWDDGLTAAERELTVVSNQTLTAVFDKILNGLQEIFDMGMQLEGSVLHNKTCVQLSVYGLTGQLLYSTSSDLDLSNFNHGIYIIHCGNFALKVVL